MTASTEDLRGAVERLSKALLAEREWHDLRWDLALDAAREASALGFKADETDAMRSAALHRKRINAIDAALSAVSLGRDISSVANSAACGLTASTASETQRKSEEGACERDDCWHSGRCQGFCQSEVTYRNFRIYHDPPPIPARNCDWHWVHEDYDGPEDNRCGHAESEEAAKADVDFWHEENSDAG